MKTISIGGFNAAGGYHEHVTAPTVEKALEEILKRVAAHRAHAELFKQYSKHLSFYHRPDHKFERINFKLVAPIIKKADRIINPRNNKNA